MENALYFCSLAIGVACLISWTPCGSRTVQLPGQCRGRGSGCCPPCCVAGDRTLPPQEANASYLRMSFFKPGCFTSISVCSVSGQP